LGNHTPLFWHTAEKIVTFRQRTLSQSSETSIFKCLFIARCHTESTERESGWRDGCICHISGLCTNGTYETKGLKPPNVGNATTFPHLYQYRLWLSITVPWPVPNYTAWWQRQLAQSCYLVADWPGVELATFRSRANALTTEPPSQDEDTHWTKQYCFTHNSE